MNNKLQTKDLINLGLFTVLYFVIGLVVIRAEAGGRVDAAGAGVHGDVIRQQQAGGLGQEGVVRQHVLKEGAGMGPAAH